MPTSQEEGPTSWQGAHGPVRFPVGAHVPLRCPVPAQVPVRRVLVAPHVPVRWQWPAPGHDPLGSLGLRTFQAGARASITPGRGAGGRKWVENNSSCSSVIQLTVNSLQGDSQLVRQDVPQPTEGSWGEGTSADYNLFCWLEAIIAPKLLFLWGGHGQWVAMAGWVARAHPAQQPVGIRQLSGEDLWGGSPFPPSQRCCQGPLASQRPGLISVSPKGTARACPCSRDAWETRQNSCWEQPSFSIF